MKIITHEHSAFTKIYVDYYNITIRKEGLRGLQLIIDVGDGRGEYW